MNCTRRPTSEHCHTTTVVGWKNTAYSWIQRLLVSRASTLCPSKSLKTNPTPADSFNQWRPSLINNSGRKAAQESMTTGMIQRPCRPGFQLWHGIHGRINNPRAVTDIKKIGALSLAVGMVGAQSRNGLTLLLFYIPPSRTLRTIRLHTNEFSY